jgi:hypothetical protein
MLRRIPSISPKGSLDSYFCSIDSKLSAYKNFKDARKLLELAIWKSKNIKINGPLTTKMRMQCQTDSVMMVTIFVPNVISFLTDDNGGNNVVYDKKYDEDDESDDNDNKEDNKEDNNDVKGSKESDNGDDYYYNDDEEDDGDGVGIDDNY